VPSSLVFAALVAAWIVVLVPMVARRRQEVRRTADSALAARVVRRGPGVRGPVVRREEVDMSDHEPMLEERRYRPGRGGFDPHAAELAARARYTFRQRVVLALLLTALVTGLLAFLAVPKLWWAHGCADVLLVSYLGYLRRQVRIEQEIRRRRQERAQSRRTRRSVAPAFDDFGEAHEVGEADEPVTEPPRSALPTPPVHPGTCVIDLDDEDPGLEDLEAEPPTPYRRASGE
jgi:hypothetical protein